ncbi:MAG: SU10 major capsid protein, partial [Mycobacterium sp.]
MPTNWGDTVTSMNAGLKTDDLQLKMIDSIYHGSQVSVMFKERGGTRFVGGKGLTAYWPVDSEQGMGMGGLSEGGVHALGHPDYQKTYSQTLAEYSFSMEVTRRAVATAAKRGASYLGDLVARKLQKVINNQQYLMGTRVFQDSTGVLGQINGAPAGNVITCDPGVTRWVRRGMRLTFRDTATSGTEQLTNPSDGTTDGGRVVDVDRENETITLSDATGAADNDYIAIADMYDNTEIEGLQFIVSQDTSRNFQGLSRSTAGHSFTKAWRVDGGGDALTVKEIMQARNRVPQYSPTGKSENVVICASFDTTVDLNELIDDKLRYHDAAKKDIGFETMQIHTTAGPTDVVPDRFMEDLNLYFIDPSVFGWLWPQGQEGGKWFDEDGNILKAKTDTAGRRADTLQAFRDLRTNLYCDEPQCCVLLD